jgi:hypothetical protein
MAVSDTGPRSSTEDPYQLFQFSNRGVSRRLTGTEVRAIGDGGTGRNPSATTLEVTAWCVCLAIDRVGCCACIAAK